jgi:hypothetical protein
MDRTERFGLVLSDTEKRVLCRLAESQGGLSQAAMLRHLLLQAARQNGLLPPGESDVREAHKEVADDRQS